MSVAILYRNREGKLRAVEQLSKKAFRSVAVHEFPNKDNAIFWAERKLPADANWQLIELDEL